MGVPRGGVRVVESSGCSKNEKKAVELNVRCPSWRDCIRNTTSCRLYLYSPPQLLTKAWTQRIVGNAFPASRALPSEDRVRLGERRKTLVGSKARLRASPLIPS